MIKLNTFDISAVFALEDMIIKLQDKDVKVVIVLKNKKLGAKLLKMGLEEIITKEELKYSLNSAISRAKDLIEN